LQFTETSRPLEVGVPDRLSAPFTWLVHSGPRWCLEPVAWLCTVLGGKSKDRVPRNHSPPPGGPSSLVVTTLSHLAGIIVAGHSKPGWSWPCSRPPHNTSRPSRATWRSKFTDASHSCRTSRPRMNSSVISSTNTQFFKALLPIVSSTSAYFKMRIVSPDTICRT
jgi:hypothetical protein